MTDDLNILRFIPGELIAQAEKSLPDAAQDKEQYREAVIDVPGRFKARITFKRFHSKRGKMSRWFWTPESAEEVE